VGPLVRTPSLDFREIIAESSIEECGVSGMILQIPPSEEAL
jgi:hypothetical protein